MIIILFISLIGVLIIGLTSNELIKILPIYIYILGTISLYRILNKEKFNFVIWIILGLLLVRNMYLINEEVSSLKTVLLICYETFIIFLTIHISYIIFFKNKENEKNKEQKIDANMHIKIGTKLLIILIILLVIIFPMILDNYSFLIQTTVEERNNALVAMQNIKTSMPALIRIFVGYFLEPLRIFLSLYLINFWYKKYSETDKGKYVRWSFYLIILNAAIMTERKLFSILFACALSVLLLYIYPRYRKTITLCSVVGIIFILLFVLVYKSYILKDRTDFQFKQTAEAYISNSYRNVETSIEMSEEYEKQYSVMDKLHMLINGDTMTTFAIIQYFFQGETTTTYLFNETYYQGAKRYDQIIPMIGQGYFYFGFVFSVLFEVAFIVMAMYYYKKVILEEMLSKKFLYIFISLLLVVMPFFYNYSIFVTYLTVYIIPTAILINLNKDRLKDDRV